MEPTNIKAEAYAYDVKYSRLIAVLEHDGLKALQTSKILIIGAGGLGAEIAKNLVLMGASNVYIQDNRTMNKPDLSSGILFKEEDIGKNTAEALYTRLLELNETVKVKIYTENAFDGFDLVCLTEARSLEHINTINTICRDSRTPFIIGDTFGVFGFVFNDFGEQFVVSNSTDHDIYSKYRDNYIATDSSKTLSFVPFNECVSNKTIAQKVICHDSANANNFLPLLRSLMIFREQYGRCPATWNMNEARVIFEQAKQFGTDLNEKLLTTLAQVSSIALSPVTSVIGGLMTHEIVKAVSHHGNPAEQFLFFECSDIVPQVAPKHNPLTQLSSRYGGLEALFGQDSVKQLQQSKVLVAGAGSIGCEVLKHLVALGVASENSGGKILIIDEGEVALHNLCNQMMYRAADLSKRKADVAADRIKQLTNGTSNVTGCDKSINNDLHLTRSECDSWAQYDVVFGVSPARHDVDKTCVYLEKPVIECGISGTKGHVHVIYPHLTENIDLMSYERSREVPHDVAFIWPKHFEHCLTWSGARIRNLLYSDLTHVKQYLDPAPKPPLPYYIQPSSIYEVFAMLPRSYEDCIKYALRNFYDNFNKEIVFVLTRPVPEWASNRTPPTPLVFNIEDPLHVTYASIIATLIAQALGLGEGKPVTKQSIESVLKYFDANTSNKIEAPKVSEDELKILIEKLAAEIELNITPVEIDIENNNDHLTLLHTCALLRARVSDIKGGSVVDTLMLSDHHVPKIITTPSIIAGLAVIELIKMRTRKNVECTTFRNSFINTHTPLIVQSYPLAVPVKQFMEIQYTLWNKIVIDEGDLTIQQLLNLLKHKYNLNVDMLAANNALIYCAYLPMHRSRLPEKVSKVVFRNTNNVDRDYIGLEIITDDDNSVEPVFIYKWDNMAQQCEKWL